MVSGVAPRFDWRRGGCYEYLMGVERPMFAWEWLRRTERYRQAWARGRHASAGERAQLARSFHLVELVAPERGADVARPIWRADCDPRVIVAAPCSRLLNWEESFDIRAVAALASLGADDEDVEHWRIGTAAESLRLDVRSGTLLGGPTALQYELCGVFQLKSSLPSLDLLLRLATGRAPGYCSGETRARRWIAELRTADALAEGARQRQIAQALFGTAAAQEWRGTSDSYRYRVQRLVRAVRQRLDNPLAPDWFR